MALACGLDFGTSNSTVGWLPGRSPASRARSLPARYVSGYLETSNVPEIGEQAASHAWVDVWLEDCGWISVDVTQAQFASEQYCRLAVGRDYAAAAPLRGMRVGGGNETLSVDVSVQVVVKSY